MRRAFVKDPVYTLAIKYPGNFVAPTCSAVANKLRAATIDSGYLQSIEFFDDFYVPTLFAHPLIRKKT